MVDESAVNHSWRLIRREDMRCFKVHGSDFGWKIHSASDCDFPPWCCHIGLGPCSWTPRAPTVDLQILTEEI